MSVLTKMPNDVRPFAYKQLAWISFFHGHRHSDAASLKVLGQFATGCSGKMGKGRTLAVANHKIADDADGCIVRVSAF